MSECGKPVTVEDSLGLVTGVVKGCLSSSPETLKRMLEVNSAAAAQFENVICCADCSMRGCELIATDAKTIFERGHFASVTLIPDCFHILEHMGDACVDVCCRGPNGNQLTRIKVSTSVSCFATA